MGLPRRQDEVDRHYHFNKGKEYALRDAEANKMEAKQHDMVFEIEAKQHDMVFEDDDEDDNQVIEAKNHEVTPPQVNDADKTRKLYEEEGVDFEKILEAQKANTRLFTGVHEIEPDEESSDEEEYTGLEVNSHWYEGIDEEEEGEEIYLENASDLLDAFGVSDSNTTSNAVPRTNTQGGNATVVQSARNSIAPGTNRRRHISVATDMIDASAPAWLPPTQDEGDDEILTVRIMFKVQRPTRLHLQITVQVQSKLLRQRTLIR